MALKPAPAPRGTQHTILRLLKQSGPTDAVAIASRLGISGMAVRQHLYAMQKAKLVDYQEHRRPIGRPAKLWGLTDRAQKIFPDAHAELTVSLLELAGEAFGKKGIEQMLALRTQKQIENYRSEVPARGPVRVRLKQLCAIREREGYMAELQSQPDGSFLLIENHCPICSAAKSCSGLCNAELTVFQRVLGKGCKIERIEHLLSGARRCAYRISEKAGKEN